MSILPGGTQPSNSCLVLSQGGVFEIKIPGPPRASTPPKKRGVVKGYTRKSQLRAMKTNRRIDWNKVNHERVAFWSLTLPRNRLHTAEELKHSIVKLEKRLMRLWPDCWIWWKVEPQKDGTPHAHMMVVDVPFFSRVVMQKHWRKCCGIPDDVFMTLPDVRRPPKPQHCASYCVKYLGKEFDLRLLEHGTYSTVWAKPGRFWGVRGRKNVPWCDQLVARFQNDKWFWKFRRVARAIAERKCGKKLWCMRSADRRGFTIFCEKDALELWALLDSMVPGGVRKPLALGDSDINDHNLPPPPKVDTTVTPWIEHAENGGVVHRWRQGLERASSWNFAL